MFRPVLCVVLGADHVQSKPSCVRLSAHGVACLTDNQELAFLACFKTKQAWLLTEGRKGQLARALKRIAGSARAPVLRICLEHVRASACTFSHTYTHAHMHVSPRCMRKREARMRKGQMRAKTEESLLRSSYAVAQCKRSCTCA
eukprot:scaffold319234_cov15-Tisochrysis_lutea.AAC.2